MRKALSTLPDFSSPAWQWSQTNLEIVHRIVDGNPPLMPAYRDKLSRDQSLALAIYVRAFAIEGGKPTAAKLEREPAPKVTKPKEPTPAPLAHMSSAQLYRAYCLSCHDKDGKGNMLRKGMPEIPDFTDAKWQNSRKDDEIKNSILAGKGKFMLPMRDKVSAADAEQMVPYVRAFRAGSKSVEPEPVPRPQPVPDVISEVQPKPNPSAKEPGEFPLDTQQAARTRVATALYRQYCLSCHGTDGRGAELRAAMPDLPDFSRRTWQEARSNSQLVVGILDGKGKLMPSFRDRVSEDQAQALLAYVRAFGPLPTPIAPGKAPTSDFDARYRRLREEWDALQKQLEQLSKKPSKP
jgi:mono/diheme cytochrome c family protein